MSTGRTFIRHSRCWYTSVQSSRGDWTEEFYLEGEGERSGFAVRWFGDIKGLEGTPKVEAFNDAFPFLFSLPVYDLLRPLANGNTWTGITPDAFQARLLAQGWQDVTPTEAPHDTEEVPA